MADIGINVTATKKGNAVEETRREIDRLASELRKLEGALEGSGRELAESIEKYRQAQRESIALKGQFRQLKQSGEGTEAMFRELATRIGQAEQKERQAIEETRKLTAEFRSAEGATDQWSDELRFLNEQLDKSQGYIDGVSVSAKRSEAAMGRWGSETRRAADGIDHLNKKGALMVAFGGVMQEVFEEAFYAVKEFAEGSIREFYEVDRGMREISTLVPGHTGQMREEMLADVQAMSISLGRMSEETIPAVYNALSSGRGTETVLEDVALASEAARAGVAELDDTMKSGLAVLNAYGEGTYSLQEIYDQFFFGIKEGVFTMSDLAGGMSELTSVSAETKTPLEDIMAALIVMTRQGDSFNEAVELSGLLLTQLGTEGSAAANAFVQATGQSYREFIAQGGTLGEALQRIQQHADATGQSIGSMIAGNSPFYRDQQAARAALELTGIHLQDVIDFSNQARDAQGSMGEAAAIMGESAEMGALRAAAAWDVFKQQAGETLLSMNLLGFGVIDTGINIENAITGAAAIMEARTGAMATSAENIIEANLEHAQSVDDLVREYQKLQEADSLYLGLGDVITGTADEINDGKNKIVDALALTADSFDEYLDALVRMGLAEANAIGVEQEYYREKYESAKASQELAEQSAIEVEEKQRSIAIMQEAREAREAETAAIVAQRLAMNDQLDAQYKNNDATEDWQHLLVNQGVAQQEAIHGLDIYRESLTSSTSLTEQMAAETELLNAQLHEEAMALAGYWQQAGTLVDGWVAAQDQGAAAIIASNDTISASYEETFFEAMLANQGLTQSTLDLMVQRGYLTQEEADLRLEIAGNNQALTELTQSQAFNKLTTEEQSAAIDALITGMAQSADSAIYLVTSGYSPLTVELSNAKLEADLLGGELDYLATVNAAPEVDMDLSGQISQAERLRQLLEDLAQHGSGGGYGGIQNPDGGTTGGGNIPEYASGGYTGNYGGLVHPNEYVFDPQATAFYGPGMLQQMQQAAHDNRQFNLGGDTIIVNDYGGGQARQALEAGANTRQQRLYQSLRLQ